MKIVSDEVPLNIGEMIGNYIKNNNISIISAAKKAKMEVDDFQKIINEASMETETLKRISVALNHNFMTDIAKIVEKEIDGC